jgi:hypothetical protein
MTVEPARLDYSCRSELARDQRLAARASSYDAALTSVRIAGFALLGRSSDAICRSELAREAFWVWVWWPRPIAVPGRSIGFALLGESLFPNAGRPAPEKVTKNACPCTGLGVPGSLRSTSVIPSLLRGSPRKGHPWPFTGGTPSPFAASMPPAPLRSDSIRPAERGVWCRLSGRAHGNRQSALHLVGWVQPINRARWVAPILRLSSMQVAQPILPSEKFQTTRTQIPFRRPSVGAAQGDARHGCRARSDGTWMSLRDDPRSSAGARGVLRSKTRMPEWPSFWLLFLGHTRKSDAPCKAQPVVPAEQSAASYSIVRAASTGSRASSLLRKAALCPAAAQPVVPATRNTTPLKHAHITRTAITGKDSAPPSLLQRCAGALERQTAFTSQVPQC